MNWRTWAGILAIPLIMIAGWYLLTKYFPDENVVRTHFAQEGNIVKDNPGFEPGVWYLAYEEPGAPGLSVPLVFDDSSRCGSEEMLKVCDISFVQGERVRVEGTKEGNVVRVISLTYHPSLTEDGLRIKLYFYKPSLDQGPGGVQCSVNGVVPVERVIPQTESPLAEVIKLLLRGELSDEERAEGITTEFPLEGVSLKKAVIENDVATLTFDDPKNKTGGGSCRVSILWHQIVATAKQFPTVRDVRLMPEELFQP